MGEREGGREREGEKEGQEKHRKLQGLNRMSTMIKKKRNILEI